MTTVYNQNQLCPDFNGGLFSLEFNPRRFDSLSFMALRAMERTPMDEIYRIINIWADFKVHRWGDMAYQSKMSSLLGQNDGWNSSEVYCIFARSRMLRELP